MDESVVERVFSQLGVNFSLKEEQRQIISNILDKQDVMGVLPIGFGKSITFVMVPLILDQIYPEYKHTSLVISPLKALIEDQVSSLKRLSIAAGAIIEGSRQTDIQDGKFTVLFASPESIILTKWQKTLRSMVSQVSVIVYDEAHCISSWGLDFRPKYREVNVVQSLFDVPNLVLTATTTQKIQEDIYEVLGFTEKTKVIATLPNRANIFLDIHVSSQKFEEELQWLIEVIRKRQKKCYYL